MSRRTALAGVVGLGVAVPALAACGSSTTSAGDPAGGSASSGATSGGSTGGSSGGSSGGSGATGVVSTADVEVGGGVILSDEEIVVTQPTEGEFKAFSAICTHQGCPVGQVTSEGIVCPCHNSVFSLEDGSPLSGPADEPLAEVAITVTGDQVTLA